MLLAKIDLIMSKVDSLCGRVQVLEEAGRFTDLEGK